MRSGVQVAWSLTAGVALALWLGTSAHAQEGSGYDRDSLSREGFVPAPAGESEAISGGGLLLAAYVALWLMLGLYVVRLVRRQGQVARELRELAGQIRDIDERLDAAERRGGA